MKRTGKKMEGMTLGILAIAFGILILLYPAMLHWLVGIYLIVAGALAISGRR